MKILKISYEIILYRALKCVPSSGKNRKEMRGTEGLSYKSFKMSAEPSVPNVYISLGQREYLLCSNLCYSVILVFNIVNLTAKVWWKCGPAYGFQSCVNTKVSSFGWSAFRVLLPLRVFSFIFHYLVEGDSTKWLYL